MDESMNGGRRRLLKLAAGAAAAGWAGGTGADAGALEGAPDSGTGRMAGNPMAIPPGEAMLRAGGNAVDAVVTAAFMAAAVSLSNCGIGGYGGAAIVAAPDGKVTAFDFNTTAPAAARPDMFPLDERGNVKDNANFHGWLAAGVPGTLAGLQLVQERHGSRPLREVMGPAIRACVEGFALPSGQAVAIRNMAPRMTDAATRRLLMPEGTPPKEGEIHRNPELGAMLQSLADRGSVDAFYRGEIAGKIADAFRAHGGLVTREDMAAYRAREVPLLELTWRGSTIRTAPLTAGGATVLEALALLRALGWEKLPLDDPKTTHTRLEVLRLAWHDRLALFGDPEQVRVPLDRLLSEKYAEAGAARIRKAVAEGKALPGGTDGFVDDGTIHLSAVDSKGMMAALTLTHGSGFGAWVAVEGLGLILGHGMSRFDPRPGKPNSVAPRKRPLHNMCPTVVLRDGRPVLAIGAAGGRKIVNSVFDVLALFVGRDLPLDAALAAPRLHTEGDLNVVSGMGLPEAHLEYLKSAGFAAKTGPAGALVSAVARG